jgi:N6-adenosine-specific RNA methylase IME4
LEYHPAANSFPMMDAKRFAELKADIAANGLREKIKLLGGKILDGRNRHKACLELGKEPQFENCDGDPWAYVWSLNGERRDLVDEQRYLIWKHCYEQSEAFKAEQQRIAERANRNRSESQKGVPKAEAKERARTECPRTLPRPGKAAKAAFSKTNPGAVARGDTLAKRRPDLAEKVRLSEMKPAEAHRVMRRDEVSKKLATLAAAGAAATDGKYDVIVLDPPWPMQKIERDCRPNQVAFDYPTMTEEQLAALEIPCADDCHVWVWTTHRFLPMALRLLYKWGLKYVCTFVWHKPGGFQPVGLPQYNCEFAVYARKGSPPFLDTKDFGVCFNAPRGEHSEKPEAFYETLRRVTGGRRLDMFNRRKIEGFDGWGNEAK